MTAEHYVALAVSAIGTVGVVVAAILPGQIKSWREQRKTRDENRADHNRVHVSVQSLQGSVAQLSEQVNTLTTLVIDSVSELRAHTKWEEGQKYASPDHIDRLIEAVTAVNTVSE